MPLGMAWEATLFLGYFRLLWHTDGVCIGLIFCDLTFEMDVHGCFLEGNGIFIQSK